MTDGLKNKYRKAIIGIFTANERVEKVVLFGSRAMGTFTSTSDVDIALFGNNLTLTDQAKFAEAIDELSIPQRVDILLHKSIKNEKLIEHIKRHGVEWYRRSWAMVSDWPKIPVADVCEIFLGGTPRRFDPTYWGGSIKWASAKDVANCTTRYLTSTEETITQKGIEESAAKLLGKNTVVITARGTVGALCMLGEPMSFNQTCYGLVGKPAISSHYLYYALKAAISQIRSISYGTVFDTITIKSFKNLMVPLPSLNQQRAIAHILGSLDDKIELNRQMNQTLEAMAQAIFKSWFVDFDPVRAKAEGRDPGLPKDIAYLFPNSFEDSELGEIPKGWKVSSIGEAVRCVGGSTPSTKNLTFWDGGTSPFVTPKDMSSLTSPVILDTARHITDAGVDKISSGRLPAGTVLLSSRAPIGYLAVTEIPVSVNQGIIAMICDRALPNYHVLYWTEANMDTIKSNAGGTTFAEISKRNFRPIQVVIPHERILKAYVHQVEPLHQQVVLNLQELNTLASLRDTLLSKLISGELRVPDCEKLMGDMI